MLSAGTIKYIKLLHLKKHRDEHRLFIAETPKIVELLLSSNFLIKEIFSMETWLQSAKNITPSIKTTVISSAELQRISTLKTPNQVLALVAMPDLTIENEAIFEGLSIVLDNVQDPGNLGTIIRIADWFGIDRIICSKTSADVFNPKVIQSTMGSIAGVSIFYEDIVTICKNKPANFPIYGTFLKGENIYTTKLRPAGFIIIGNEAHGISKEVAQHVTHQLTIPSFSAQPSAESLNAAIATAIVCSEFTKQKTRPF